MRYSICIDNHQLESVRLISVNWTTPFINLFFDKGKAREKLFADNGQNWQYSDTDDSFKTVLMDVALDDQDHIHTITIYKYQATSFNHGKNSSKELKPNAADINKCVEVLSDVVQNPSAQELELLLSVLKESEYAKERQLTLRKNDFSVLDDKGVVKKVKYQTLQKALQISHTYLEILNGDLVFVVDEKEFPAVIQPVLHEVLSFVDTSNYYRIDSLQKEMQYRELIRRAEDQYPLLREAVINENLEEVKKLAAFARLVPEVNPEGAPLYHAVVKNNLEIASLLLENSAYTLEMDRDAKHFALEEAYLNGNREMAKLLIGYHGAKSRTYSVTKHNMDKTLMECAKNKDFEMLELMAPDPYTFDTRTWLAPDMFPDMEYETIQEIVRCKDTRMAWGLDQIKSIYEKKEYDLCRNMMLQGSTKEVVEFFVAQDDYEMFEASVKCHSTVYVSNETCNLVFERGGKWLETLSKHVVSLYQKEDHYFASLLDNGNVDRYLQIVEKRGCSFMGLEGYMVWPEKVDNPEPYLRLIRIFMDRVSEIKRRLLFLEDIIRFYGDETLAKEYYAKYPLSADTVWWPFRQHTIERYYILDDKAKNPYAGAELIRSFFVQDVKDKNQKAYQLFSDLVAGSSLWKPMDIEEDEGKLYGKEIRCQYMLKALLDCVSLQKMNEVIKQNDRNHELKNAYQYAMKYGKNIRNKLFLDMLQ